MEYKEFIDKICDIVEKEEFLFSNENLLNCCSTLEIGNWDAFSADIFELVHSNREMRKYYDSLDRKIKFRVFQDVLLYFLTKFLHEKDGLGFSYVIATTSDESQIQKLAAKSLKEAGFKCVTRKPRVNYNGSKVLFWIKYWDK